MELILLDKILLALINITAISLTVWVYLSGENRPKTNKYFSLVTLSMLSWVNAGYFLTYSSSLKQALLWAKIAPASVFIFFVLFYIFSLFFPKEQKRHVIINYLLIFWGVLWSLITLSTPYIIKGVQFEEWGINPIFNNWGKFVFYGTVLFFTLLIIYNLIKNYFASTVNVKKKIQYLLVGFFIFIVMNLIFNIGLPLLRGNIQYWQFGNYSAICLLGFTAYAIVKKELFDIKVALTSIVVVLIAILLTVEFFTLTVGVGMMVLKGITLAGFLVLSLFLFQAMNKEAKQKDELMHLAEHLERANRELKKLDHTKSEFLSIASHQLRTPLTAMRGYLSMLIQGDFGPLSPKVKEVSQEVYQASLRLLKLANDLLNVSQIESGKITLVYEKTSIEKLAKSVIDELKIEADKKGLYLKMIIAEDLPEIEIDSEKIRQVLLNIIDNAIKYTKKGGVTVKIGLSGSDHVLIKVQDTGVGMTKEDIGKLFRSFSRGKAGTSLHSSGAGLGLYAARKFVDQHKGRLWVKSPGRNQGSTFFIELPIKQG